MRKLLSLTAKELLSGISNFPHLGNMGLWTTAIGMNPFITPGVLKVQSLYTDLTSNIVKDVPTASVADGTSLYILGDAGHFYEIATLNATPTLTDRRSASPVSTSGSGIAIFQTNGGTKYLYYWQNAQIGRWDLSAGTGGFTDNYIGSGGTINTALQSTIYHPVHKMFDEVYYGNLDRIGKLSDVAGTFTHNDNVLDFPSDNIVTALSDDGTYLVAALSRGSVITSLYASSKVIFWDKNSSSWNKEMVIRDPYISALKEKNGFIYAWGTRGLWAFNYATAPVLLRTDITAQIGYPNQMDAFNDALVAGTYTYGKVVPGVPIALFRPYGAQMAGTPTLVDANASSQYTFFGTTSKEICYFNNNTALGVVSNPHFNATTIYIPLDDIYQIQQLVVIRDEPLQATEDIRFGVRTCVADSLRDFVHMSYAVHGAKKEVKLPLTAGSAVIGRSIKLEINTVTGVGSGRIKQIDIYGEPHKFN